MRQIEFLADEEGDWAFHCHKSHHTMNAMGHGVPTMIGVDHRGVARQITKLIPDYMVMGERGMKDMTEMEMPLPDNTAPMMAGRGPFGAIGMGGMFSVVKVRKRPEAGRLQRPGLVPAPAGHRGLRVHRQPARPGALQGRGRPLDAAVSRPEIEVRVRKPGRRTRTSRKAHAHQPRPETGGHGAPGPVRREQKQKPGASPASPAPCGARSRCAWATTCASRPTASTCARARRCAFVVRNDGRLMHEFVIGTRPELDAHAELMEKVSRHGARRALHGHVEPGKTGEIVWTFNRAGSSTSPA
jgi:hypothetical protein